MKIGKKLLRTLSASSIVITRGRLGMSLFEPGRRVRSAEIVGSSEAAASEVLEMIDATEWAGRSSTG